MDESYKVNRYKNYVEYKSGNISRSVHAVERYIRTTWKNNQNAFIKKNGEIISIFNFYLSHLTLFV
ncbi:hypothetical protein bcgnr5372_39020 [Bacillus luti]